MFSILEQVNEVKTEIKYIEEYNEQFKLLPEMDFFMIDYGVILFIDSFFNQHKRVKSHSGGR